MIELAVIPNYPNQRLSYFLDNQAITLVLSWRGYTGLPELEQEFINTYAKPTFYADFYIANKLIVAGMQCIDKQYINQYPSALVGKFIFINEDGASPNLSNIGVTSKLYYGGR